MYAKQHNKWVPLLMLDNLTSTKDDATGVAMSHKNAGGKGVVFEPTRTVMDNPIYVMGGVLTVDATGLTIKTGTKTVKLTTDAAGLVSDSPISATALATGRVTHCCERQHQRLADRGEHHSERHARRRCAQRLERHDRWCRSERQQGHRLEQGSTRRAAPSTATAPVPSCAAAARTGSYVQVTQVPDQPARRRLHRRVQPDAGLHQLDPLHPLRRCPHWLLRSDFSGVTPAWATSPRVRS